jgi:hypothetical protein
MKKLIFTILIMSFYACRPPAERNRVLQDRVDSLEKKLADSYKPGLGEFMTGIQMHHSKLWFAGQNQNWKLADFEIHEMQESIQNIRKYQTGRKESKLMEVLNPAIDSVNAAIQHKSPSRFKNSFVLLTNTCNNCHKATQFEFNLVKTPISSPFSNQDFSLNESK